MTWTPVLWILAFIPALIALYFLKLRRRDVVVSSTILWRRAVEEFRVNAPFQRLRRNWLLLLQLLVLCGLILAIWKPMLTGEGAGGRDLIVLMDNSASTAAEEEGGRRMELAKRDALDLVRGMREGDRMTLLAFSSKTVPLGQASSDQALLEARIESLGSTALPTDLEQALRVAASIAESVPSPTIYVIGDGCYGSLADLPPEMKRLPIRFVGKGTALDNVGITEADVRQNFEAERRTEVFALVENQGTAEAKTVVSLSIEGELRDARELALPAGGSESVVFDVTGVEAGMARIALDSGGALAADDVAWVRIAPPRTISVLVVGPSNPWIELVLKAVRGTRHRRVSASDLLALVAETSQESLEERLDADVMIFDRDAPAVEPVVPSIYVGCLPPGMTPPPKVKRPVIVDWDRTHPIQRFLVYTDISIEESYAFPPGADYRSLLDCDSGSVAGILLRRSPGRRVLPLLLLGFDILATNWPLGHYSYPIFFSNAVRWLGSGEAEADKARWRAGELLVYRPKPGESVGGAVVRSPSGRVAPATVEAGGELTFSGSDEAGVYELRVGEEVRARFPVSLLSARESRLAPTGKIDFGDYSVDVQRRTLEQGRQLWKWLALGALAFIAIEWLVYHRRLI